VSAVAPAAAPERLRAAKTIGPPSFSPTRIAGDLKRLAQYTDLLLTLTHHRIRVRYKQSSLGILWAILQPLALMVIYTVIFSVVTRVQTGRTPYAIFVFTGLLPWTFFSSSVTAGANCLVTHSQLITKVWFPREILPLTYVFSAGFDLMIAALVLAAMMLYYRIAPGPEVVWLLPIMLIAALFAAAVALALSATQVWFRDIGLALPLALQVWMFACPVVYPLTSVPLRFRALYILNPMAGVIENFRRVLIGGQSPDMASLASAAAITLVVLMAAYLYFKNREAIMADVI